MVTPKTQFFKHNSTWFVLTEYEWTNLRIWCLDWSPQPIQDLLNEIMNVGEKMEEVTVYTVYLPFPGGAYEWQKRSSTHRRTFESVYLNEGVKEMLIDDISDYLDHDAPNWYANKDIPHRRGYLLHGRPGCGKTLFTMAVAGEFKLNIYTISLLDKGSNESILRNLFQRFTTGDLVVLEDIDSAGIGRQLQELPTLTEAGNKPQAGEKEPRDPKSDSESSDEESESIDDDADYKKKSEKKKSSKSSKKPKTKPSKKRKREVKKPEPKIEPPSQVTLSGLLNAIDGASAPQGDLLIMTSNKPDLLDDTLIRPGRVDVRIEFELASREQIRDMFAKIYMPFRHEQKLSYGMDTVRSLAEELSNLVPAGKFSPAMLQEYLFTHRVRPQNAIEKIEKCVERNLAKEVAAPDSDTADGGFIKVEPVPEPKASGISRLFNFGQEGLGGWGTSW